MKITILYHEVKEKIFKRETFLRKFLNSKLDEEILGVNVEVELDGKVAIHSLKIREFLKNHKYGRRK